MHGGVNFIRVVVTVVFAAAVAVAVVVAVAIAGCSRGRTWTRARWACTVFRVQRAGR